MTQKWQDRIHTFNLSAHGISYQYSTKNGLVFGITSLSSLLVVLQNDGELWILNYEKSKIVHHSILDLVHFDQIWTIVEIDGSDDFFIKPVKVKF